MANEYLLEKFDSGMHYIILDKETVNQFTKDNNYRVLCNLNNQIEFNCAIIQKKEGGSFINTSTIICKKLKINKGAMVKAVFSFDNSNYQFEMPVEFQEVLNTDKDADKIFHSLTVGNQRGLIYLVTKVKSSDKRIERALQIVTKKKCYYCTK